MPSLAKTILFAANVTLLCLVVFPVFAQLPDSVDGGTYNLASGSDVEASLGKILNVVLGLVGILAVIYIIYGGIKYIISSGNESEAEKAKHTILYAVIGLIIVALAAAIVNFTLGAIKGQQAPNDPDTDTDNYNVPTVNPDIGNIS